jgi:NAD(P)-dependent dehydrogenase (short-subunit alcohol dehydrogenase family)
MSSSRRPVTVVTGAGRGIGAAIANRLARAGHDIVVNYHSDARSAAEVVAQVEAVGARALAVRADVTDDAGVDALFAAAAEWGAITGLVNNAGATLKIADLVETPAAIIRQVIEVNLIATILCARRAAQLMDGGSIVNISSGAATTGSPHEYVHYAAAKAGVDAFTQGLAKELGPRGIRVNAVSPGLINTGIHAAAGDPGRLERVVGRVPMGRVGEPDEIAGAVAWLFGPDAAFVSGAVLRIAGGM